MLRGFENTAVKVWVLLCCGQRTGIAEVQEIEFRPARLTDDENRNKS